MRTTIDLPDELVRAARVQAAASDETLKDLFTRALSAELGRTRRRVRKTLPVIASSAPGRSQITPAELEQILVDDEVRSEDSDRIGHPGR